MFTVADGPTAVRAELVRALSLSLNAIEPEGADLDGRFCAALAAVWNGKKGTVALLLRHLDEPVLRRHVFSGPLTFCRPFSPWYQARTKATKKPAIRRISRVRPKP